MNPLFGPCDHAEAVAMFRAAIIGHLAHATLARGQLRSALDELSKQTFRPPGAVAGRTYAFSTLERWYYAFKKGGLEALKPKPRSDRGHGQNLSDELKTLLCDIRRDHPTASVPLIMDTLIRQGQLDKGAVSASTVRRLLRRRGLTRATGLVYRDQPQRLRWEAEAPMTLWHADVCHGSPICVDGVNKSVRIHAVLDDASRFVVAIEACESEREQDMLELFADTLRRRPAPQSLYLDNGSTYSGHLLKTVCDRLGVGLIHATPYSPQARGKMERFFRTLRERCLNHVGKLTSFDELNKRLWAFIDEDYHPRPHAGLMGRTPKEVFVDEKPDDARWINEKSLRQAFVAKTSRQVRTDSTLSVEGELFEVDQRFLCGRKVDVCFCVLDEHPTPYVLFEGRRFSLHPVDVKQNAHRQRRPADNDSPTVEFDPAKTLVDQAVGRTPQPTTTTQKEQS